MSSEKPPIGDVDPAHVGPPDLILQEIVALSEVAEDARKRAESLAAMDPRPGSTWADVTFAGRALALVEGTDQPDYDDYGDPSVWVFALSAESPMLGEVIVSVGGFTSSSGEIRLSKGEPTRDGKRVSFLSAIRTEPRGTPDGSLAATESG